eukprot:scaffold15475_cov31-Tisochrysis_lutea.AAC.1
MADARARSSQPASSSQRACMQAAAYCHLRKRYRWRKALRRAVTRGTAAASRLRASGTPCQARKTAPSKWCAMNKYARRVRTATRILTSRAEIHRSIDALSVAWREASIGDRSDVGPLFPAACSVFFPTTYASPVGRGQEGGAHGQPRCAAPPRTTARSSPNPPNTSCRAEWHDGSVKGPVEQSSHETELYRRAMRKMRSGLSHHSGACLLACIGSVPLPYGSTSRSACCDRLRQHARSRLSLACEISLACRMLEPAAICPLGLVCGARAAGRTPRICGERGGLRCEASRAAAPPARASSTSGC